MILKSDARILVMLEESVVPLMLFGVSVSLDDVGVGRFISCVGVWLGITLVLHHTHPGATSVDSVRVPFETESMRGVTEVPSIDM